MSLDLGISYDGLKYALSIKDSYRTREPLTVTGAGDKKRLLMPEHLLSNDLALLQYDDPLALAVIATKDPESPMALAAATRMGPHAKCKELISGIFEVVGDATKHELVHDCIKLLTKNAFSPESMHVVRNRASNHVVEIREFYRRAMTENLRALLDGKREARDFVDEFIELATSGNLRIEIYKRLVIKLMRSDAVRPSVKFMLLERLDCFPQMVKIQIVSEVNAAPDTAEYQTLKQELRWIYDAKTREAKRDSAEKTGKSWLAPAKMDFGVAVGMQASRSVDGVRGRDAFRNARNTAPGFNSRDIASWLS
ncbi:hypothetical protein [Thalassospira sp. MCCC 1A01428]|uniref:hypothetical protein n=1 Tax=Thalassospira sp. MCCC 1A01428 TaxID=1470575 RepID=UPI000A1D9558|nr:hypothetical protein [Thalassospira sp. MCCC 1A01428]OSQ42039.1 hypothetical protein THS27_16130 [Thalassospira sp. MCCC 1A01428]